jgi:hypothetical protein
MRLELTNLGLELSSSRLETLLRRACCIDALLGASLCVQSKLVSFGCAGSEGRRLRRGRLVRRLGRRRACLCRRDLLLELAPRLHQTSLCDRRCLRIRTLVGGREIPLERLLEGDEGLPLGAACALTGVEGPLRGIEQLPLRCLCRRFFRLLLL